MYSQKPFIVLTLVVLFFGATLTRAQEPSSSPETPCISSSVISVPSRPTVASATDTTQCGVVELEYGLERQWREVALIATISPAGCVLASPRNSISTGPRQSSST